MTYLHLREPFSAGSHGLWLLLSIPATMILWRRCENDLAKRLSFLVFGVTFAACYLGSVLFHGMIVGRDGIELLDRLDHLGIHLLIAGSYTPIAWNMLRGRWRSVTLVAVWSATIVASALLVADLEMPSTLETSKFLLLGWGALFCYFQLARTLSHRALWPLLLGGILYSIGAILNLAHWPAPWPGVVGPHEVFHLWVMGGTFAHFWFMLTVVAPFAFVVEGASGPQLELVHTDPRGQQAARVRWARDKTVCQR
jgi:hemolysin III